MRYPRRWRSRPPSNKAGRQNRRVSRKKIWLIAILIMFVLTIQTFIYVEKNIRADLLNLANIRLKQLATNAMNQAITSSVASSDAYYDKLIDWQMDTQGKVSGFSLNYSVHMKITSEAITVITESLNSVKNMRERIPVGQAMNSALLASFGPSIPVRLVPLGAVKVDINTRVRDAGINMILVEVYMRAMTEARIIIPFSTQSEVIQTELPISYVLVVGDVPSYYFDGKGNPLGSNAPQAPVVTFPNVPVPGPSGTSIPGSVGR